MKNFSFFLRYIFFRQVFCFPLKISFSEEENILSWQHCSGNFFKFSQLVNRKSLYETHTFSDEFSYIAMRFFERNTERIV